jgi:hypothetical protein
MVRVGPEVFSDALMPPHVREIDFTGRTMNGYESTGKATIRTGTGLKKWINAGLALAEEFPATAKMRHFNNSGSKGTAAFLSGIQETPWSSRNKTATTRRLAPHSQRHPGQPMKFDAT